MSWRCNRERLMRSVVWQIHGQTSVYQQGVTLHHAVTAPRDKLGRGFPLETSIAGMTCHKDLASFARAWTPLPALGAKSEHLIFWTLCLKGRSGCVKGQVTADSFCACDHAIACVIVVTRTDLAWRLSPTVKSFMPLFVFLFPISWPRKLIAPLCFFFRFSFGV